MIDQTVINRLAKRIKDIPPFPEAPKDGKTYLRKNGAWEEVKQDGWYPALETWTRTGDYEIEINGDVTDKYDAGYKFKCVQDGTTKYGYFLKLEYSAGKTTITVSQNVALTAHSITDAYFSNVARPHSFPYGLAKVYAGTWNTGAITIKGISNFRDEIFKVIMSGQATAMICEFVGSQFRGGGIFGSAAPMAATYHFAATISGETLTFGNCYQCNHAESASHDAYTNRTVSEIYIKL